MNESYKSYGLFDDQEQNVEDASSEDESHVDSTLSPLKVQTRDSENS